MEGWETRYFPALADFALGGGSQGKVIAGLRLELLGVSTDEILRHHEESVRILLSNADIEDRMTLMHRSLLFLVEILASLRLPETAAGQELDDDRLKAAMVESLPIAEERPSPFETVLQHMDSGVALFGADGQLRFLNVQMAKMLQAPRRMLIGNTFRQLLFHPYLRKSVKSVFLRMYKEMVYNRRFYSEFQEASSGRFLLVSISQIEELGGDYLISVKDVSEYKQIEQTAFQNDKLAMLGKIAASIAHEIRNPLTSIRGFIQLLRPYLESVGKQEYARIILSEIDRANDIIYEFLNSSKPSAPMKQKLSVASLIKETVLLTESEAHMKGCELQYEIYDPSISVAIDVKQIKQVLLNMVKNAVDAIQEAGDRRKGLIAISVRREGRMAAIRIRDNGKGMDRTTLNRLFDPFFTTKEEGNGLGLSVSYRIIRNHGGTIQVDSQVNEGTEFVIYLPSDIERE